MTNKTPDKRTARPISPFMIGPYYKPQLSSMLSIAHRASGVFLSLIGAAFMVYWLLALSQGPVAYHQAMTLFTSMTGKILLGLLCFAVYYHFFNGIRHLIWDSGRMLEIKQANRSAIMVLLTSAIAAVLTILASGGLI